MIMQLTDGAILYPERLLIDYPRIWISFWQRVVQSYLSLNLLESEVDRADGLN